MEYLLERLEKFNFTKLEAQIYLCLLKNGDLNGSQIAKIINIPRTSVYSALESLYKKGNVSMLLGEPTVYKVQDPKVLIEKLKEDYSESIDILENSLTKFNVFGAEDQYWNIKGYESFINNTKCILNATKREVYISTNFDIQLFKVELSALAKRKVKIILFSFENLNVSDLMLEFYHHAKNKEELEEKRWMMVSDNQKAIIANQNKYGQVLGTFTENNLMTSIIAEHIHHDIYLLNLKKKFSRNLITKDIIVNSEFERNSDMFKDVAEDK